jgi:3-oxoadipate enol-lactonase
MGGMTGMWLLTHAADRLDRAILANTAAHMGPPDGWNTRIRTVLAKGMEPIAAALKDRWFTKALQAKGSADMERIVATFRTISPEGYAACCGAIRDMDQREALRAVKGKPVLVIIGKQDPATPPAAGALVADAIPGAKTKMIDAAHLSNVEKPDVFAKAVLEFLK